MAQRRARLGIFVPAAMLAMVAQGCSNGVTSPPDTTPAMIVIVSGNNQTAQVGTALGSPLVVRVTNAAGSALSGVTVNWSVLAGGGMLGSASSTTNAQGQAQVGYTVGATAIANQVRATVQGGTTLTATFSATASAAIDNTPAVITVVSGNNQSATVGQALPNPLVVRVANAANQAIPNVVVSWTVTQGGGTLGSATSTTNAQGQASNSYTVGASAGANEVRAALQTNAAINTLFAATANAVATTASVAVTNFQFTPASATVAAGGTVTWNFNQGTHNVTWVSGGFTNSGDMSSGTHQVTFPSAGTFQYYCSIHGTPTTGMRGSVTVQ